MTVSEHRVPVPNDGAPAGQAEGRPLGRRRFARPGAARNGRVFLLVASSGGHLHELLEIADEYPRARRHWVTFDKPDARALLAGEATTYAHGPTNRSVRKLFRNAVTAFRLIRRLRPAAVITTGAGVGVPFVLVGRAFGARTVYVESLARADHLSLAGRLVYPVVDRFFVQWPDLASRHRKCEYAGAIIDIRDAGDA